MQLTFKFVQCATEYAQQFWEIGGAFCQNQWDKILNCFNNDDYLLFVWGTFFIINLVYWGVGLLYTTVDLTGKPSFLLQYRIQDVTACQVSLKQVLGVVFQVLINQIVIGIPFLLLAFQLLVWRGYDNSNIIPTFPKILFELIVFALVEEVAFYYSHRVLHYPCIYKYIHKQHHEWTSPIAITATYCNPIEYIFSNLLPLLLGPLILGSHVITQWIWYVMAILNTLNAHSGFHLPFFPSPEAHNYHHLKFNQNYGVMGFLDRFHGTDAIFRKSKMYQHHFMLLSLKPIKRLYIDASQKII